VTKTETQAIKSIHQARERQESIAKGKGLGPTTPYHKDWQPGERIACVRALRRRLSSLLQRRQRFGGTFAITTDATADRCLLATRGVKGPARFSHSSTRFFASARFFRARFFRARGSGSSGRLCVVALDAIGERARHERIGPLQQPRLVAVAQQLPELLVESVGGLVWRNRSMAKQYMDIHT
jgi:hypothetical protein